MKEGNKAFHLGIYKRDNQTVFCAWKLKEVEKNENNKKKETLFLFSLLSSFF